MCSVMFKQRKDFENNIFWNTKHNSREKGLILQDHKTAVSLYFCTQAAAR